MACAHLNRTITENLKGHAIHRWKKGEYDWSDEVIHIFSVEVKCPDCGYNKLYVREREDIPDEVWKDIHKARTFERGIVQ